MIKKISIVLFALYAIGMHSTQAQAITIGFDPGSQSVELGEVATVDLTISDLDDDILTTFDLDISFDDSILGFLDFTFGTGLDTFALGNPIGIGPPLNGVDDIEPGLSDPSLVNVFELSFDFDEDLMAYQPPDEFVLGTFTFDTLSIGTSALDITVNYLGGEFVFDDALGYEVASELEAELQSGSITVAEVAQVPAPAAIWLFGIGLIGLFGVSKCRKTA